MTARAFPPDSGVLPQGDSPDGGPSGEVVRAPGAKPALRTPWLGSVWATRSNGDEI